MNVSRNIQMSRPLLELRSRHVVVLPMSSKEGVKTREVQTRHRVIKDLRSGLK